MIISRKNFFYVSWVTSLSVVALICSLPVETAASKSLILELDRISVQYLPNALAMAGDSAHQVQIRVSYLCAMLFAVLLALVATTLIKGKTDLKTELRHNSPHASPWAVITVLLLFVAFPFFPIPDQENHRAVKAISEAVRASRIGLLLFCYTLLIGYFVAWFVIILSMKQVLRVR
uniref:Uncharacterized protein n=1 Tax=Hydrogenophaga sp. PL2G6 TaxID=503997 RepID=B4Y328_9BURK|nr:hypothetical protein [Hydrogenophaga sp. PL2G6]